MPEVEPEVEDVAQTELHEIATGWERDVDRLRKVHASLPVSPREEAMLLGEEEADVSTEVRSAIECVIPDRIEPAIQTLREAATYRPKGTK
ncbi:MAG TPA: hypothetical protein VF179_27670 [Thermoanaerobaculia bacterium]|nr:hypothetical protein [Thermoanaerobaculia bacterium]